MPTTKDVSTKELPKWLWERITGSAGTAYGARDDEKRGAVRLPAGGRAVVWWTLAGGRPGTERSAGVIVRDISPSGVGLVMAGPMRHGEQFVLHIPCLGLAERAPVALGCVAVRCERRKEAGTLLFRVGAKFTAFPGGDRDADRGPAGVTGLANRHEASPAEIERLRRAVLE